MSNSGSIKAGQAWVEVRADASKVADDIDKGVMHELKHGLGGRSEFKDAVELLKGGGAVVGLTLAADAFKGLADGGIKFKEAMEDANKKTADMVQEFMKAVPVLSQIEAAGESINDLFTGEKTGLEKANKEFSQLTEFMDTVKAQGRETQAIFDGWATTIEGIRRDAKRMTLLPNQVPLAESQWAFADKKKALEDKADEDRLKFNNQLGRLMQERDAYGHRDSPGPAPTMMDGNGNRFPTQDPDEKRAWDEAMVKYQHAQQIQKRIDAAVANRKKVDDELRDGLKKAGGLAEDQRTLAAMTEYFGPVESDGQFNLEQRDKLTKANILDDIRSYDAKLADGAASDNAIADNQIKDLDKRNAAKSGRDSLENDTANARQSIIDSLLPKGQKFDQEKQYLESIGLTGKDLERATRKAHDDIFGQETGRGQFGGLGAEQAFGNGGGQDRITKATEETAKNTKRLLTSGGLKFS